MLIQLNDIYRLTTDRMNVVLEQKKIATDKESKNYGQTNWCNVGYYADLEQAIKGCIKHHINTSDLEGVNEIIDAILTMADEISDTIKDEETRRNEIEQLKAERDEFKSAWEGLKIEKS